MSEREISGLSQEELWDAHAACRTAYQRDLQGLRDEVDDQRAENERLQEAAVTVGGDLLEHWAECPLPPDAGCELCHRWFKARAVLTACGQPEGPAALSGSSEQPHVHS